MGTGSASATGVTCNVQLLGHLYKLQPSLDGHIGDMRSRQKELRAGKKRLAKELRNAEKRRRRFRARCKELPAEDLLEVLAMRRVRDAAAAASNEEEPPDKS